MTPLRALAAIALAAACAAALAAASRMPYAPEAGAAEAALRFAWRAASEPVQHCRTPSAEELAQLPVHMRRKEICERRLPASRLTVALDGVPRLDERFEPAGSQGDRPAVVLRELRVPPGPHRLEVEFVAEREGAEPHTLAADLALKPGEVALVTVGESGALVLKRRGG